MLSVEIAATIFADVVLALIAMQKEIIDFTLFEVLLALVAEDATLSLHLVRWWLALGQLH